MVCGGKGRATVYVLTRTLHEDCCKEPARAGYLDHQPLATTDAETKLDLNLEGPAHGMVNDRLRGL